MKKLIFLLMLFKGCVAFGQSEKLSNFYNDTDGFFSDSATRYIFSNSYRYPDTFFITRYKPELVFDTVPCLMLVTDTGFVTMNLDDSLIEVPAIPVAYCLKGYEVMRDFYVHKEYLDANKNPLPKNVVVWLSQHILNPAPQ